MKKIVGKTFTGVDVPLDGHHYDKCKFRSCIFVYAGTGHLALKNSDVTDCDLMFTGAAANTVVMMKAIYSKMGDWGRQTIVNTFVEIAPDLKNLH